MKLFVIKLLFFVVSIICFYELLFLAGFSPTITDNHAFDQKMLKLSDHPLKKVEVMALGSSIALFQLKSEEIVPVVKYSYYNFSAWSLQLTDTRRLAEHFVKIYHPRYVIIGSSISDFKLNADTTLDYYLKSKRFVQQHYQLFYLQSDNTLYRIARRRLLEWPHSFDNWGREPIGYPTDTAWIKPWQAYKDPFPTKLTNDNYRALDTLATYLKAEKIKLIFIQYPIAPEYLSTQDRKDQLIKHFNLCRAIVNRNNGVYLNYHDVKQFGNILFYDRYHLTEAGVGIVSKKIAKDLKAIIR